MRASLLALLVLFVAVIAGAAVDAQNPRITYYYGDSACSSASSRTYVLTGSSILGECYNYEATYSRSQESLSLTKCNTSTGKFSYVAYAGSFCNNGVRDRLTDAAVGECQALSTVNGNAGSLRVSCSAAQIAFSFILIVASVMALLI